MKQLPWVPNASIYLETLPRGRSPPYDVWVIPRRLHERLVVPAIILRPHSQGQKETRKEKGRGGIFCLPRIHHIFLYI